MNFCNKEVTERIDNFITENKHQIIEELIQLVRIPSVSENGMEDMKAFCENEKMPDVSFVPDGEYPYYSGEKNIIKFELTSHTSLKTIKKFKGGRASNVVLGELLTELEYSDKLLEEISKVCANDERFYLEHNQKNIKITTKGKSNHIAKISNSVNAAQITAEKLCMCESICESDKIILNDVIKFIDGGYGQGFGIEHIDKDFGALVCGNGIVNSTLDGKLKLVFDVRSGPSLETAYLIDLVTKTTLKNWQVLFLRNSKGYITDESQSVPTKIREVYKYLSETMDEKTLKISGGTYARMLKNAFAIGDIAPYKTKPISLPEGHGGYHQPDEKLSIDGFLEGIKILVCLVLEIDALIN